ncbi:unnamed protein product [Spirodela intermedia]|uniref:Uncharacterized protein n=1 Tax=Spirodela intermedia TaxID=51605 RepID=A0ABN7ECL7_SPIIN|nr:unnamed protein product [Spirodela intermedia]
MICKYRMNHDKQKNSWKLKFYKNIINLNIK